MSQRTESVHDPAPDGAAALITLPIDCMPTELKIAALQDALRADGVDLDRGGEEQDIWR